MRTAVFQCGATRKIIVLEERRSVPETVQVTQGLPQKSTCTSAAEYIADLLGGNGHQATIPDSFDRLVSHYGTTMQKVL